MQALFSSFFYSSAWKLSLLLPRINIGCVLEVAAAHFESILTSELEIKKRILPSWASQLKSYLLSQCSSKNATNAHYASTVQIINFLKCLHQIPHFSEEMFRAKKIVFSCAKAQNGYLLVPSARVVWTNFVSTAAERKANTPLHRTSFACFN